MASLSDLSPTLLALVAAQLSNADLGRLACCSRRLRSRVCRV